MARRYPSAKVTGLDLAPIQPTLVYRNVKFYVDNITSTIYREQPGTYDLVHIHELRGCITDWRGLVGKYFE
jgi:hypothetical protein